MFIGAYWDARQETLDETAARISSALQSLATVNDEFSTWFKKGRSKKVARLKPVQNEVDTVASVLKTNNRDDDGTAILDLGFNIELWNGSDSFPCSFDATCGGYSNFVKNFVVLQLPSEASAMAILSEKSLKEMLLEIVKAFDPDVAVLTSNEYIDRAGGGAPWDAGGWLVYRREDGIASLRVNEPVGVLDPRTST